MNQSYSDLNEAETRADLIDPALRAAGWGVVEGSRVAREQRISLGRLQGGGGRRATPEIADYVLIYRNRKLAVVEAKRRSAPVTQGLGQAKGYAVKLQTRFAFATNGLGIYQVDMQTGGEGHVDAYPTPDELWAVTFDPPQTPTQSQAQSWQERFAAIPFETKGGQWDARYYQHNAITAVLDALSQGQDRLLLTLATGTGKTAIAFQIAWTLFHSRWNLTDWRRGLPLGQEPSRRPRILFLADRNILADQAFNAFSAFPEDALIRIAPDEIRRRGGVPTNGSLFFTIFQTFMTGTDANGDPSPNFGDYAPDFFDFIVIDECHRGGANDESTWRAIMDYFAPAVQLGLTATPKRTVNADTYAYFGEPVYVYSLKEGINDGYLTPFKVKQISTTLDEYMYTSDDTVVEGEIEAGRRYVEPEFNRTIEIEARERKRVEIFMLEMDPRQKTLVFCATQAHALLIRDTINQIKSSPNPFYCVRVTADDGERGEQDLRTFQDNEKSIPTILTTSQKLSTGVDARNVRNIVLLRPVNSMIEFKQIIGRGTRLFDGKDYFTVYDFVKAYEHFSDPEWDGEPAEPLIYEPGPGQEGRPTHDPPAGGDGGYAVSKVVVKLADGKERTIQHMMTTSFWHPDGTPMSAAQFIESLYGELPQLFQDEAELRELWGDPLTRRKLLKGLDDRGYGQPQLEELGRVIDSPDSDLYDVLAYIAFAQPPISREVRVNSHRPLIYAAFGDPKQREFLDFVLDHYIQQGVGELDQEKLSPLLVLKYHALGDAKAVLGDVPDILSLFLGFQKHLYAQQAA